MLFWVFFHQMLLQEIAGEISITKIAYGSCTNFEKYPDIDIFSSILDSNPDLYIWLGDFAYVDDKVLLFKSKLPSMETVISRFSLTKNHPTYQKMLQSFPVIGIWDDHDYGQNDGNKYNPHKYVMQQIFLDYLGEPLESPRRKRSGIYFSYKIKPNIKIVLLDCRFNKDSWFEEKHDMLGEEQWAWLSEELEEKNIDLFLLGSGTQFLPDDRFITESWYPKSKNRLYELIKSKGKKVVLLSGDVHYGEIMQHPCSCQSVGYPLFEITSSGMTHYFSLDGLSYLFDDRVANFVFPDTFNTPADRFFNYNFGTILISEDLSRKGDINISLQIRDINNIVKLERKLSLGVMQESCRDSKEELCILDEKREVRFVKNAFGKIFGLDTYVYTVFVAMFATLVFIFSVLGLMFQKILRVFNCFKHKKE